MKPTDRQGLMNPLFKYTRAEDTDLRKTFARIRAGMGVAPLPIMPPQRPEKK